jgi:broad specificity phosphatase PhoE
MEIIFVRHGQSEGDEASAKLTKVGRKQAKLLGRKLKVENIDKIYCSDMVRSIETAEIISRYVNKKPIVKKELREFDHDKIMIDSKKWMSAEKKQLKSLRSFLKNLEKRRKRNERVLIVGHAHTNRFIIGYLMNVKNTLLFLRQKHCCINKAEWNHFKVGKGKIYVWKLTEFNNVSFVPERLQTLSNVK